MPTLFRLLHDGDTIEIDVDAFGSILPPEISIAHRDNYLYAEVISDFSEDTSTQSLIDRELDRLFYLTHVRLHAEMCRTRVTKDLICSYAIHGAIPKGSKPLKWTENLALQYKLWSLATLTNDPMVKVLLFFQIIEISYPDTKDKIAYPPYTVATCKPSPRTEAKLLRHLVAHAGEAKKETANYLRFLGLPTRLSNLTHHNWMPKLAERLPIIEAQAREVLAVAQID